MSPAQQEPRQHPPPSGPSADQHLQILGVLSAVLGGIAVIAGIAVFVMAVLVGYTLGLEAGTEVPRAWVGGMFGVMAFLFVAFGTFYIVTGVGLWRHRSWSKIPGFIASALALLNVPIGTAYGIYGFYVLTRPEVVERLEGAYRVSPRTPEAEPAAQADTAADDRPHGQAGAGEPSREPSE